MKKATLCFLLLFLPGWSLFSQVSVSADGHAPDSSAMLDVQSADKGILIPRLTQNERNSMPSPASGLLIYNTGTSLFNYFNGRYWYEIGTMLVTVSTGTDRPGGGVSVSAVPTAGADSSAMLDVSDATKGILIPRTTPAAISSPASGLIIYNTASNTLNYYNGSQWITLCGISTGTEAATGSRAASGVAINADGTLPHHSAILDVASSGKGLLIPRLTDSQRNLLFPVPGLTIYNSSSGSIEFYNGSGWYQLISSSIAAPAAGIHFASSGRISWHWNTVPGAAGYKWNSTGDYETALDLGTVTMMNEPGLVCDSTYTRYAWAYHACGNSDATILTQSTAACPFICGTSTLTVNHLAGPVAPVNKTVVYGTSTNVPGELSKCWITSNLGSDHQATAVNDTSEASAGWYWQFNRKQGFKHTGSVRTPGVAWVSYISESSDWKLANDPCSMELGSSWRIPTYTEWFNVDVAGSWNNWNGPWGSLLKLHAAGHLSYYTGNLLSRGVSGYYASSTSYYSYYNYYLGFLTEASYVSDEDKSWGYTLRCLTSRCDSAPSSPESGIHSANTSQIVWNWDSVADAQGYKWNTSYNYETATDLGFATTITETGLACNTNHIRYLWAYNACGFSMVSVLTQTTPAIPVAPSAGIHPASATQIIWNWGAVAGAAGYRWNMTDNYSTATDLGNVTTRSETALACNTAYNRYVWAYSACGHSVPLMLTQSTSGCTFSCGQNFTIHHVAGTISPVNKTVMYGTVKSLPGDTSKCWISRNLGADRQAVAVNDTAEISAGWYWQFNRKQGFRHTGTIRTPNTTWINSISESSDWLSANDPCTNELGNGWRIPTYTEWYNVDNSGGWTNWNGPWNSGLKLHGAGYLVYSSGALTIRGQQGTYWTGTQTNNTTAGFIIFYSTASTIFFDTKAYGFSLRCLINNCTSAPSSPTAAVSNTTTTQITWNWNAVPEAAGYRWNTTNDYGTATDMGTATTKTETGLTCNTPYTRYVWAYNGCFSSSSIPLTMTTALVPDAPSAGAHPASSTQIIWNWSSVPEASGYKWNTTSNYATATDLGTSTTRSETGLTCTTSYTRYAWAYNACSNSIPVTMTQATSSCTFACGQNFTINHTAGTVSPVTKTVMYGTVTHIPGDTAKCWITSNLGSDRQATTVNDATEPSAGWYWQFNQKQGFRHDGTTLTPTAPWITLVTDYSDWAAANDPCTIELGSTWRIPTITEWQNVASAGGWTNWIGPWNSALKLHSAGYLAYATGTLTSRGAQGNFWGSLQSSVTHARFMMFGNSYYYPDFSDTKAYGFSLRCLRNDCSSPPAIPASGLINVSSGQINWQWNSVPGADRYKWNTTNNYASATDLGTSTTRTETGLTCNTLYTRYVWAYNACGASGPLTLTRSTSSCTFACGQNITAYHIGGPVAPENKTVMYGTVKNIPGDTAKCWITSNLGADRQATGVNDATEASAGWYWQFNRRQGYKHDGTSRTPNTTWLTSFSENTDWEVANDPCAIELGAIWRVPTYTEWNNVDATGNWTNWDGPWNSALKLHTAGYLAFSNAALTIRGSQGTFWSGSTNGASNAYFLIFGSNYSFIHNDTKAYGFSLRCLTANCTAAPATPASGTHNASATQVIWNWLPVSGAAGYKWNTANNYATATDMGISCTKSETGLTCNTAYSRYVWAYNTCGTSTPLTITKSTAGCAFVCGQNITANHVAGATAPVNKTAMYGTVSDIPGDTTKCWITSNLGSDRQAMAANDGTEPSAGWYWQFNRKQGYKHDGMNRTPGTAWISGITESSDWMPANDPCSVELGIAWRIPTYTEWNNVDNAGGWANWNGPWNSGLKLHASGAFLYQNGALVVRGTSVNYWSSTQSSSTHAYSLVFSNALSVISNDFKTYGFPVRCLTTECLSAPAVPSAGTHSASATQIIWKWNSVTGAAGYKWNTVNNYSTATNLGPVTTRSETGLTCNNSYTRYVWAYSACGTSSPVTLTKSTALCAFTCGQNITAYHVAGVVTPVSKTVMYGTVTNIPDDTTKCWITNNLGADRQAPAVDDTSEASAGWYWQFNRKQGYRHNGISVTPAWTIPAINENSDWLTANDPCTLELGSAWRVPTNSEWYNVSIAGGWTNWNGPWNSPLKLHAAGFLLYSNGSLNVRGLQGTYWTSTQITPTNAYFPIFSAASYTNNYSDTKAFGFSLRCLRLNCSAAPAIPTSGTHTATATQIIWNWNAVSWAAGYKWNTTNNYATATDMGKTTTKTETGLTCNTAYTRYVWAYNACGNSGPVTLTKTSGFCCGQTITATHVAGTVAPVTKTVTYSTVSAIPGETAKCWITRNLGASQQASSSGDASEASAGWYWQFNRMQGYKHDGTNRTPSTWVTSINENANWQAANDPCTLLLGSVWRVPTSTEWSNVKTAGNWTNATGPWNSALKMHKSGYLWYSNGVLDLRGSNGYFWGATQVANDAATSINYSDTYNQMQNLSKQFGFSVRCITP